jgi:hypothetical protein
MAGTEHFGRPRRRVRSTRYLPLNNAWYCLFTDLPLSCSSLPPSPDDFNRAFWLGREGFYRYSCAATSTGYGPGASMANVFNPLNAQQAGLHLRIDLLGRLDTLTNTFICKSLKTQRWFLTHVLVAGLVTRQVFRRVNPSIGAHGE